MNNFYVLSGIYIASVLSNAGHNDFMLVIGILYLVLGFWSDKYER